MHAQPNVWAILTATASAFVLGGLWYSPVLFESAWSRANGFTTATRPKPSPAVFAGAIGLTLLMAVNLAMFLNEPTTTWVWGATAGFLAGFGWATLSIGVIALFESRPLSYVLVNGGYVTLAFVVMGAIIGAWR